MNYILGAVLGGIIFFLTILKKKMFFLADDSITIGIITLRKNLINWGKGLFLAFRGVKSQINQT